MISGTEMAIPRIQVVATTHQTKAMLIFLVFGKTMATNLSALIAIKLNTPPRSKEPGRNAFH